MSGELEAELPSFEAELPSVEAELPPYMMDWEWLDQESDTCFETDSESKPPLLASDDDNAIDINSDEEPGDQKHVRRRLRGKGPHPSTFVRRRSEVRGERFGLPPVLYCRLVRIGVPALLFNVLYL